MNVKEGISYQYVNKGIVNDKESEASVHYTKPKKLVKQGYGQVNGSQNEKYSSGNVNTNYLSRNGKLYYRIIFTPDSNDDISFTDTLPEGTKLFIKENVQIIQMLVINLIQQIVALLKQFITVMSIVNFIVMVMEI